MRLLRFRTQWKAQECTTNSNYTLINNILEPTSANGIFDRGTAQMMLKIVGRIARSEDLYQRFNCLIIRYATFTKSTNFVIKTYLERAITNKPYKQMHDTLDMSAEK